MKEEVAKTVDGTGDTKSEGVEAQEPTLSNGTEEANPDGASTVSPNGVDDSLKKEDANEKSDNTAASFDENKAAEETESVQGDADETGDSTQSENPKTADSPKSFPPVNGRPGEIRKCEYCGHVGSSETFYSATKRFCSIGCCHRYSASYQKKKPLQKESSYYPSQKEGYSTRERGVGSPTGHSKKFDWTSYLTSTNSKAAPLSCFLPRFFPTKNPFQTGMKVELAIDMTQEPVNVHVMTVAQVLGMHVRLSYDGAPEGASMQVRPIDSPDLFRIGWCVEHGGEILPPPGALPELVQGWTEFMQKNLHRASIAPKECFVREEVTNFPEFIVRHVVELELKEEEDKARFVVASVTEVKDNTLSLKVNSGTASEQVYYIQKDAPSLHPIRYCEERGLELTLPKDAAKDEAFDWENYLQLISGTPAPRELFTKTNNLFAPGMKLEAMDVDTAPEIYVATVIETEGESLKIHYDGWSSEFDIWLKRDSRNIFPAGWCAEHGYILQPPLEKEKAPTMTITTRSSTGTLPSSRHLDSLSFLDEELSPPASRSRKRSRHSSKGSTSTPPAKKPAPVPSVPLPMTIGSQKGAPRAVFSVSCNTGPYLDHNKVELLPREICGSSVAVVLQSVLQHLINCGENQMFVFEQIRSGQSNSTVQCVTQTGERFIKHIQIADRNNILWSIVTGMLRKLQCCENFIQPRSLGGRCTKCKGTSVSGSAGTAYDATAVHVYEASMSSTATEQQLPAAASPAQATHSVSATSAFDEYTTQQATNATLLTNGNAWSGVEILPAAVSQAYATYQPVVPLVSRPTATMFSAPAPHAPLNGSNGTVLAKGSLTSAGMAKSPELWTVSEVAEYFHSTPDCAEFGTTLAEQEIDGKALLLLTPDTLSKYMGMRLGPSLKICSHITNLKTHWNIT